jgi:hypothetical protein
MIISPVVNQITLNLLNSPYGVSRPNSRSLTRKLIKTAWLVDYKPDSIVFKFWEVIVSLWHAESDLRIEVDIVVPGQPVGAVQLSAG